MLLVSGKSGWRMGVMAISLLVVCAGAQGITLGGIETLPKVDAIVAQDGSGDYRTVGEALAAAPEKRGFRIYVKKGAYFEKLQIAKANITLIGESVAETRIFYNHCSSDAGGTSKSASVAVTGDGFRAENISFENTFDYDRSTARNKQAVALLTQGDRLVLKNCRIIGHQDTLNIRAPGRQYFENCYIEGHTDFIFGEGTAVFKDCTLHSLYRNGASITAPATLAATQYGFVFMDCMLTGAEGMINSVYLGRPWHPSSAKEPVNSSAVFIRCHLGPHIAASGWTSMSGVQPNGERFREYQNTGVGAAVNPSRPQLSADQAAGYTVAAILGGTDKWDPKTPED